MARFSSSFMLFAIFLCFNAYAVTKNQLFYRNFWNPTYLGQRLAYCSLDGTACGLALANKYCRRMGYHHANHQRMAPNVGLTHFLDTRARCKGWQCNGFKNIRCVSFIPKNSTHPYYYRFKKFVFPRYDSYRIDWCYSNQQGCGRKAAYSFCRRMGYLQVKNFCQEKGVAATKAIGNGQLCFGHLCKGFSAITCYR